jgi:hypothetical protein
MLDVYKRLQANGVIGPMMKVNSAGSIIVDPGGEKPGNLVPRPRQEYPKVVRRYSADGTRVFETIVGSKNEELRLLAENPEMSDTPLSPLEQERDALARENAEQNKTIMSMQDKMEEMMRKMSELSQKMENDAAKAVAVGGRSDPPPTAPGKGIEALATQRK